MHQVFRLNQTAYIISSLLKNEVGILPTDTIYGIHCLASNQTLVDRIYKIKERPPEKKVITLISDISQLQQFNLKISEVHKKLMQEKWPGKNTIIFENETGETISFRLPDNEFLKQIIDKTGPLISTSANKHGQPNVKDIKEAMEVFGDEIDFYVDGGDLVGTASSVFIVENGLTKQLR